MDEKKFITTTDQETADMLLSFGFCLVAQSGNSYTFLNQSYNFNADSINKTKMVYTNILNV